MATVALVLPGSGRDADEGAAVLRAHPELDAVEAAGGDVGGALASALARAGPGGVVVVVHDASQAALRGDVVSRVLASLREDTAAVAAVAAAPVTDTIKRVGPDRRVAETLDRDVLWELGTPQAYRVAALGAALTAEVVDALRAGDHAVLAATVTGPVRIVPLGAVQAPSSRSARSTSAG